MSYRPRLVAAGKPVGISSIEDVDDFLNSEYEKAIANESDRHHHHHNRHHHHHKPQQSDRPSSLKAASAASSTYATRTPSRRTDKLQTKFVIGGAGDQIAEKPLQNTRKLITKFEISEGSKSHSQYRKNSHDSCSSMMEVEDGHNDNSHQFHPPQHSVPSTMHHQVCQHSHPQGMAAEREILHGDETERMEIDDIHLQRLPLVIMDGANIAYAYAQANGTTSTSFNTTSSQRSSSIEPDMLGIKIAVSYFLKAGCRVQVVVPQYFMRRKPRDGNNYSANALAPLPQLDILNSLKDQNILCCSPPTDDDDSYCIAIARRIDAKFCARRKGSSLQTHACTHWSISNDLTAMGGAFILSNDLFRDAQNRDMTGDLTRWLNGEDDIVLPKRLSYSFAELGSTNKYGDLQLDFVPNPRHPLVAMIERLNRQHDHI
mmetsp:Transcript_26075/g.38587  ORF Transcript_26075/g.38587 Transcript_26075/m.38587 type:complete len:430 (+) Transcript_26075:102-1391(+)